MSNMGYNLTAISMQLIQGSFISAHTSVYIINFSSLGIIIYHHSIVYMLRLFRVILPLLFPAS